MYSDGQSGTGAMATREARELDKEQQKHLGADDAGPMDDGHQRS